MAQSQGRGRWLIKLIVLKKVLLALVLLAISFAALFGQSHYAELSDFAQSWGQADRELLSHLAEQGTLLGPTRLIRLAIASAVYSGLILLAAWATWTGRHWGEWLLVGVLALALPLEVIHLLHEPSPRTAIVLGLTVLGMVVTLKQALRSFRHH
ncbi:hypothetical protein SynMEDNS5_02160 [Synechococcus sp. MEDNS5]|uniref:DUF2127 domain-containing protein n=1 Tax=Synechococcus sp. MEDNS5 TaxID=1442554 RepID=UPI001645B492|nr:DUF2127 domain-containing protein [Synechococcus sp. MEDNS5]QNJ06863.1 hypothetical protein SynMEDNS5_02160 [Synechococcus sp. MEDNS5]